MSQQSSSRVTRSQSAQGEPLVPTVDNPDRPSVARSDNATSLSALREQVLQMTTEATDAIHARVSIPGSYADPDETIQAEPTITVGEGNPNESTATAADIIGGRSIPRTTVESVSDPDESTLSEDIGRTPDTTEPVATQVETAQTTGPEHFWNARASISPGGIISIRRRVPTDPTAGIEDQIDPVPPYAPNPLELHTGRYGPTNIPREERHLYSAHPLTGVRTRSQASNAIEAPIPQRPIQVTEQIEAPPQIRIEERPANPTPPRPHLSSPAPVEVPPEGDKYERLLNGGVGDTWITPSLVASRPRSRPRTPTPRPSAKSQPLDAYGISFDSPACSASTSNACRHSALDFRSFAPISFPPACRLISRLLTSHLVFLLYYRWSARRAQYTVWLACLPRIWWYNVRWDQVTLVAAVLVSANMPAADPEDQREARDFERSLREDVAAGCAHRATLEWFERQPKRIRRSLKLIVETAKQDKAELERRNGDEIPSRSMGPPKTRPSHRLLPCPAVPNPFVALRSETHSETRQQNHWDALQRPSAQPRDLSCLKGFGNPWAGIGQRKTRLRAFCATGRAYVRHQSIASFVPVPVFALEAPPNPYPRPVTPPGLREALFGCIGLPRTADGPATYGLNTPIVTQPRPPSPVLPLFEQLVIPPEELLVYGRRVNPWMAYVIARGRQAMGLRGSQHIHDAVTDIIPLNIYITPLACALLLFPSLAHDDEQEALTSPRDDQGRFLPRSASATSSSAAVPGAFPTPVSLARPTVSTPSVPSSDSSSPSLTSLILAEPSVPSTPVAPLADLAPPGVPFPSPLPNHPPNPFLSPSTPTPTTRVRRLATYSDPPRPSAAVVDRLAQTYLPPVPIVTVSARPTPTTPIPSQTTTTPTQKSTMSKDLRAARSSLGSLPRFNDDMDPMREAEWRHNFIVATRGVTDEERAQLWGDWLVFQGVAYDWYEALQQSGASGMADSKDWTKLLPLIEACWPTPVRDPFVLAEQKRHRWDSSVFRVEVMLPALLDSSNATKPHEVWAKQHLSRGKDRGSSDADLIHDTLKRAIPAYLVQLLPKRARYGSDFEGLCKDIGELSSEEIVNAHAINKAVLLLQTLSIGAPVERSTPRTTTQVAPSFSSSVRRTPSFTAPSSTASQATIPAPVFTATQSTGRAPQVTFATAAPETPARNLPIRQTPPHLTAPQPAATTVMATATLAAPVPQTPLQHPLRDPAPDLVAENTPSERARYNGLVAEFHAKFGDDTPNMSKPYPLSPGTFKQTRDVCIKCGRAFHTAVQCKDRSAWVPEEERTMRGVILGSLIRSAKAGSMQGTPTPGPRFVRDTAQLEEEAEEEQLAQYESENEQGFEQTIYDVDSYFSPPEVVDLYEIFDPTKYKDNPFRVWAQVARMDETGPNLDARVTVDGGAMLCVMDKTYWVRVEADLGSLAKSPIVCRMADGSCTRSIGRGKARVAVAEQWHEIEFEVLDSRGNYDLLLGKPWLRMAGAAQVFSGDTLLISGPDGPIELKNGHPLPATPALSKPAQPQVPPQFATPEPILDHDHNQLNEQVEETRLREQENGEPVPLRRSRRLRKEPAVELDESDNPFWLDGALVERLEQWIGMSTECELDDGRADEYKKTESVAVQKVETESEDEFLERMWRLAFQERKEMTQREILLTELVEQDAKVPRLQDVLDRALRALARAKGPADIYVLENDHLERHPTAQRRVETPPTVESDRTTNPFDQDRVADIQRKVTIGDDLTPDQRKRVMDLVGEYADIFARSLSEVLPIDFMQMRLDVPEGTQFPRRPGQKRLTEPQREWLYKTLDDMERAKIIAKVPQDQVAAVSPTNIVPKPGGAELPSLASLRRMANEQCRLYGLPVLWPDVEVEGPEEAPQPTETKYRLVHNFAAVNKVTQLRPFPMGDLPNMQRKVAGH
ncbi:Retrovirus-related Pol polyprotein from transposon [Ceratobasidium sp. AG-Ba]|nr:Retrovirus-related Pol polyprotein from transposon [Ceratobasidium sp. AG-Ba]